MRMIKRLPRDERGAVLVLVAVFAIVAVIFLAFVVDIGNQRQDRRQLTTATDAAAFDVAQSWARNSLKPLSGFVPAGINAWNCTALSDTYLNKNRPVDAGDYECDAALVNQQFASVTVRAAGTTEYQVGQAIGLDRGDVASSSTVRIRSSVGGGLRPFAICAREPAVLAWFNAGGLVETNITLGNDKFLPEECGENNGNWGFVIFDMDQKGQKDLARIIRDGSDDRFESFDNGINGKPLDPYADEKAVCVDDAANKARYDDQDPVTCLFNDQGAAGWNNNNALEAFKYLRDNKITFSLPIYGEIQHLGPGQDTGFPIIAFAEVQLVSFNKKNPPAQTYNDITLKFMNLSRGECCDVNDSNYVLELCDVGTTSGAVLADFTGNCRTFKGSLGSGGTVPPASTTSTSSTSTSSTSSSTTSTTAPTDCVITSLTLTPGGATSSRVKVQKNGTLEQDVSIGLQFNAHENCSGISLEIRGRDYSNDARDVSIVQPVLDPASGTASYVYPGNVDTFWGDGSNSANGTVVMKYGSQEISKTLYLN